MQLFKIHLSRYAMYYTLYQEILCKEAGLKLKYIMLFSCSTCISDITQETSVNSITLDTATTDAAAN